MAEQNWRVLIVDDEPPIRAELNYLLKQDARVGQVEEAGGAMPAGREDPVVSSRRACSWTSRCPAQVACSLPTACITSSTRRSLCS